MYASAFSDLHHQAQAASLNKDTKVGLLASRIPSSARLEHQATHDSPHAAASPHPIADSPLAADGSRLGSEGPQRSITLSVDGKRKAASQPEAEPLRSTAAQPGTMR